MKIRKHITFVATLLMVAMLLTACGNASGGAKSYEKAPMLSEYTENGDAAILYQMHGEISKDRGPDVYVFENGLIYIAEIGKLGDLSKMTDEEIIAAVKSEDSTPGDYIWRVYTDDTGNATDYEELYYNNHGSSSSHNVGQTEINGVVFDSYYAGVQTEDGWTTAARCKEGTVPFRLDDPDAKSEHIAVDVEYSEIKQMLGME